MKRPKPYDRTTHDGKTVDWLTKAALMKAERILGYTLSITQGSYQALDGTANDVKQSAGTHDGGGVVDLREWDWQSKVRALRRSGFVASYRDPSEGPWPGHIHAVLECNKKLAPSARRQVEAYHVGLNGLANNGPDRHQGMVFKGFDWPYGGVVGAIRWRLEQLEGRKQERFVRRVRKVTRTK